MFRKSICLLLSLMLLITMFPVGAFAAEGDVEQYIPLKDNMETVDTVTKVKSTLQSGSVSLTQDRIEGKYAIKIVAGNTPTTGVSCTLANSNQSFSIVDYSKIKISVKPGTSAKWAKFYVDNNVFITNDKNGDGIFEVGVDLVAGKWNELTLDLTKTSSSDLTQVTKLVVQMNVNSSWTYDQLKSEFAPVSNVDTDTMVNDLTQMVSGKLQFKSSGATTFNTTPTILTSNQTGKVNKTFTAQDDFKKGILTNTTTTFQEDLRLKSNSIAVGGNNHTLIRTQTIASMGENADGQLGDGTQTSRTSPVQPNITGVAAISAGESHTVALKTDGTVWTWGRNNNGQLGDGTNITRTSPVQIQNLTGVISVAANGNTSYALKSDGTVWAWGGNWYYQVGDGTSSARNTPVQVANLTEIVAIAAGGSSCFAIKADGTVWAWGYNNRGQLGDGTTVNRSKPIIIKSLKGVVSISVGEFHGLALKSDGTILAWGYNNCGQLGDGTIQTRYIPVQVENLSGVIAVQAGGIHSIALKFDGTAWAWGHNDYGQLGDGTTNGKCSPVQVENLTNVVAIAAGTFHSVAIKSDGNVYTWGYNEYGQLGDGTTTNKSTPVQVSNITCSQIYNFGSWVSETLNISSAGVPRSSSISWNAAVPTNSSLVVQTNLCLNGKWQGWKPVTNSAEIPGVTGVELINAKLQVRVNMASANGTDTPILNDLTVNITGEGKVLPEGQISKISIDSNYYDAVSQTETSTLATDRVLISGVKPKYFGLSGNSNKVYYTNPSDSKLYTLDLWTGENSPVSEVICSPVEIKVNYDGKRVALRDSGNNLYLYDAVNRTVTSVASDVNHVAISDNGTLCYSKGTSSNSWVGILTPSGFTDGSQQGSTYTVDEVDISRDGKSYYYTVSNTNLSQYLMYGYSLIDGGSLTTATYKLDKTITEIMTNYDGSSVYYKNSGDWYSYNVESKAVKKLGIPYGKIVKAVTNQDKLIVPNGDTNGLMIYDTHTDKYYSAGVGDVGSISSTSTIARVDSTGSKIVYVSTSGLKSHYLNTPQRPERYLLSFDGKGSWMTYKKGVWTTVTVGGSPTEQQLIQYGMAVDEVNALDEADFTGLYNDGRQITHFDVAVRLASVDANTTPVLKGITVTVKGCEQGVNGEVLEKALYTEKSQSFTSTSWRKMRKIYPVEIAPKEAEMYYFVIADGAYKTYQNGQWMDVDSDLLKEVEGNWIDSTNGRGISQIGMTADELKAIPQTALGQLLPANNITVAYAMKVQDVSTAEYISLITVDYVENHFEKTNLTLKITMVDGTLKQYSLSKQETEDFATWYSERQYNRGPVAYRITITNTSTNLKTYDYINYYMIQSFTVEEVS